MTTPRRLQTLALTLSAALLCSTSGLAHADVLAAAGAAGSTVQLPLANSGVEASDVVLFADSRVKVAGQVKPAAAGPATATVKIPAGVSPGELTYEIVAADGSVRPTLRGDRGRLFVVRTLTGGSATKDGKTSVKAASLAPVEAGRSATIALEGAGLSAVTEGRVTGSRVFVDRVVAASDSLLLVDLRVPGGATGGAVKLELRTATDSLTVQGLSVDADEAAQASKPTLKVRSITPSKLPVGGRTLVAVSGPGVLDADVTSTVPCARVVDSLTADDARLILVEVAADCPTGRAALRLSAKGVEKPADAKFAIVKGERKGFEGVAPSGATVPARPMFRWNGPGATQGPARISVVALPPGGKGPDPTTLAPDVVFEVPAGTFYTGLPASLESLAAGGRYAWWVSDLGSHGEVTTTSGPRSITVAAPSTRRLAVSPSQLHLGPGDKAKLTVSVLDGGAPVAAMVVAAALPSDRVTVTEQEDGSWQVVASRSSGPALIVFTSDDSIGHASVVVRARGGVTPTSPGGPCEGTSVPSIEPGTPTFELDAAGAGSEAKLQVFELPRMCLAPEAAESWTTKPVYSAPVGGKKRVEATGFIPTKGRTYAWGVTWSDAEGAPSHSPLWCFHAGPSKAAKTRPADVAKALGLGKQAWTASSGAAKNACNGCSVSSAVLAGPSPSLTLAEIDHSKIGWPRTLPLKARAEDTDVLDVRCSHCDGSFKQYAIRDGVHPGADDVSGYKWAITVGQGSLNAPWSDAGIVAARDAIDRHTSEVEAAQKVLADANAAIPPQERHLGELKARRVAASTKVAGFAQHLSALEARLRNAEQRRRIAETLIVAPRAELAVVRARAAAIEVAPSPSVKELHTHTKAVRELLAAQAGIDEEVDALERRLFELQAHTTRWSNATRIQALEKQIAAAEAYRLTRFTVACKKAASAVPLMLTLSPASAAGRLEAAHSLKTFRTFLEICDLEVPASLPEHMTKSRPVQALCQSVAYGVPRPSPTQLEISMACRAVHYAVQSLDAERTLRRELADVKNQGTLPDPREEMQTLRRDLARLAGDRADVRDKLLQAQDDQRRAMLDVPPRERPVQLELYGLQEGEAAATAAIAELELQLQLIRAEERRLHGEIAQVDADRRRARRDVRALDDDIARTNEDIATANAARDAAKRALEAVEAKRSALDEATSEAWDSLSPVREATGQLVWYSPPPLEVLLNDAPEARARLDGLREQRRKARAGLAALEEHLSGVWADQLVRLEELVDLTGEYKALLVGLQRLQTRKARLERKAGERTTRLGEVAEARKKALEELASRLSALGAPATVEMLSRQRAQAKAALKAAGEARTRAVTALNVALADLQAKDRALSEARGEVGSAHRLLLEEISTMLGYRVTVYEHRLEVKVLETRDRLIENLVGESNRDLIVGTDEDERKAIAARQAELADQLRRDEQAGEDTRKRIRALRDRLVTLRGDAVAAERARDLALSVYQQAMGPLNQAREAERDAMTRIVQTRQSIQDVWSSAREIVLDAMDVAAGERDGGAEVAEELALVGRDALIALKTEVDALRGGVVAVPSAYRGDKLVAHTSALSALRPLVDGVNKRLGEASQQGKAAGSARAALPGTELQRLRDEIVAAEAAMAANAKTRSALHARIQERMQAAKASRDRAISDDLAEARQAVAKAEAAYERGLAETRKQLVDAIEVKLTLRAKDRGSSVGKADDAEVTSTVTITFDSDLRPKVVMPSVSSSGAGLAEHLAASCLPGRFASPGPAHAWTSTRSLPATVYADELFSGFVWSRDVDAVDTACTALTPECALSGVGNTQLVTEEHSYGWTLADGPGSAGGGGALIGGSGDGSAVLRAPTPEQIGRGDKGACDKTVLVTVAAGAAGDLGADRPPAAKVIPVAVRAGHVDAPSARRGAPPQVEALMGAPVEIAFDVYRLAEAGTPLADNVPFRVPLDGRDVTLRVERVAGDADPEKRAGDWGFGGKPETTVKTADGKATAMLTMSKTPGRYRVTATWRDGDACRASVDVRTPLRLDSRVLYAPSGAGFYAHVLPLIERGTASEADLQAALQKTLQEDQKADVTKPGDAAAAVGTNASGLRSDRVDGALQAWTILSDRDFNPVPSRTVRVVPEERGVRAGELAANASKEARKNTSTVVSTAGVLGLARAPLLAEDDNGYEAFPAGQRATVRVELTDPEAPRFAAAPYPARAEFGDGTQTRVAWIGRFDAQGTTAAMFRLDLARAATPGKPYHGKARVTFSAFGGSDAGAVLVLEEAEVGGLVIGEDGQARAGAVRFEHRGEPPSTDGAAPRGCRIWPGKTIVCVGRLEVTPGEDARVQGFVDLPLRAAADGAVTRSGRIRFDTTWNPRDGALLELMEALPAIPLTADGSASLARGASAVLDLSRVRSPSQRADSWRGLHIRNAELALPKLRGGDTAPRVAIGAVDWAWPLHSNHPDGSTVRSGLNTGLPGLAGARLRDVSVRLRDGVFTVDSAGVTIAAAGAAGTIHGDVTHFDDTWRMALSTASPLTFAERLGLTLAPGARGVFSEGGLARLEGGVWLRTGELPPTHFAGWQADPRSSAMSLRAKDMHTPVTLAGEMPATVQGATFAHELVVDAPAAAKTRLEVAMRMPVAGSGEAPGSLTIQLDDAGVSRDLGVDAKVYVAGSSLSGRLSWEAGALSGHVSTSKEEPGGLGAAFGNAELRVTSGQSTDQTTSERYWWMTGSGQLSPAAPGHALPQSPLTIASGYLAYGWHHDTPADRALTGTPLLVPVAPQSVKADVHVGDLGAGATLRGRMTADLTHGGPFEMALTGDLVLFDEEDVSFGQGSLHLGRRGGVTGHVDAFMELGKPGGSLAHMPARLAIAGRGDRFEMGTAAVEALLGEGLLRAWGDARVLVDARKRAGEVALTVAAGGHGEWEWPYNDSEAKMRADVVATGTLGVEFKAGRDGGASFRLDNAEVQYSGWVGGTAELGYTRAHSGWWLIEGDAAVCYPVLCLKPLVDTSVEVHGFDMTLGPANLDIGGCTASCGLRE